MRNLKKMTKADLIDLVGALQYKLSTTSPSFKSMYSTYEVLDGDLYNTTEDFTVVAAAELEDFHIWLGARLDG